MSENTAEINSGPAAKPKRSSGRSPNYPFFDLERSVSRARQLYDRERTHATPVMTALKHWGYTNATGKGGMTLSALKQFGLLEDVGRGDSRRVQLTPRAYDILHTPHEEERAGLLREAALTPEIHQEMWEQYGRALPSDSSLAWTLTKERNFTTTGAADFIRQWKRTMEYAQLDAGLAPEHLIEDETDEPVAFGEMTPGDMKADPNYEKNQQRGRQVLDQIMSAPPRTHEVSGRVEIQSNVTGSANRIQEYPIPIALAGRPPVVISGAFPLSESEWAQFKVVLDAMKPVLVGDPAPATPSEAAEDPQ